jgi:hypothetical protein
VRAGGLTAAQRQLHALDRATKLPAVLNLAYAVAVDGALDTAALAEAFRLLVLSHEPLRTVYRERDGVVTAEVVADERALAAVDLEPRDVDEEEAALAAQRERDRAFDLTEETPLRVSLLRLAPQRHVLLLTLHHIAGDGWSLYLINREVTASYAALVRGERLEPAPREFECFEQASTQREWLAGPAAEQESVWWTDRLRGAEPRLTVLGTPDQAAGAVLRRQVAVLPDDLGARLRTLARQSGVSLYVVLLTAFEVVLERWTGIGRAVIGTLSANRPTAPSSEIMGAHYNPLLLDTDVSGDHSLVECLLNTSARVLSALDHQTLPFAVLRTTLAERFGDDWAAAPAAMFLMDRYPVEGLRLTGCRLTGLHVDDRAGPVTAVPAATAANLSFFVREAGDRLTLSVFYPENDDGCGDGEVAAAMRAYQEILIALCETPESLVDELVLSLNEPPEIAAPSRPSGPPVLSEIVPCAPVDALSPVGDWVERG